MEKQRYTRGTGLLEPFLAQVRARQANKLIPKHLRTGRILDVGCGSFPYFLSHTSFKEKFAIDNQPLSPSQPDIEWYQLDLNADACLPFDDGFFSVITMLAVIEHLSPASLVQLFGEAHRTLRKEGMILLTSPAAWSDGLLQMMSRLNLVSEEEIKEHVYVYTLPLIGWYFGKAGFEMDKVHFGYFELMLNLWATATK
jgi:SAM-dependent methyltransferase